MEKETRDQEISQLLMWGLLEANVKVFQTWNYFPQLPKYQDLQSNTNQIKGILPYT